MVRCPVRARAAALGDEADPPDLSCKHRTRQYTVDDPLHSCKQQVGGSSPPASSHSRRSQACKPCLAGPDATPSASVPAMPRPGGRVPGPTTGRRPTERAVGQLTGFGGDRLSAAALTADPRPGGLGRRPNGGGGAGSSGRGPSQPAGSPCFGQRCRRSGSGPRATSGRRRHPAVAPRRCRSGARRRAPPWR
jgi:hypothetical protein